MWAVSGRLWGDRGFTWSASQGYTFLTPLPGYSRSSAYGVNDYAQVVGSSSSPSTYTHACLWQDGQPVEDLGTLIGTDSRARAINNAGQIVGDSAGRAFLWDRKDGMQSLDSGPFYSIATGINDLGMVVGDHGTHPFAWTSYAGMTDLGPTDSIEFHAWDVNDLGQILCNVSSCPASVWQDGQILEAAIGFPSYYPGSTGACTAYDINNLGQVVGAGRMVGKGDELQPFIWDLTNRTQALPTMAGLSRQYACAINDQGVIVGYARDSTSVDHILIWTPVPEPSSLLALLAGVGSFAVLLRRRRRSR